MDARLADLADDSEERVIGELSMAGPKESGQRINFERLQRPAAEASVRTSRRSDKAPSINPVPPGLHETYSPLAKHETASVIPRKPQLTPMTTEEIRSLTPGADSRGKLSMNSRVVEQYEFRGYSPANVIRNPVLCYITWVGLSWADSADKHGIAHEDALHAIGERVLRRAGFR